MMHGSEITREMRNCFKLNDNENTRWQILRVPVNTPEGKLRLETLTLEREGASRI